LAETKKLALVGSESLMGREVREVFSQDGVPFDLKLIGDEEEEAGKLTEQAGEAAFVAALEADALEGAEAVLLAGSAESSRHALELAPDAAVIDLTYATEHMPEARVRAPMVEPEGAAEPARVQIVAHPAAIAIALFLGRVHRAHPVRAAVMHVFEPASERGSRGVDELHQQTLNLFAFRGVPKEVFDEQLSFNMLARYGEEAPVTLESAEGRMERHLATLLSLSGGAPPMPSVRLVQAPVFHGHSLSAWVEFQERPAAEELEQALESDLIDVRRAGTDPPTAVGMAGLSGIAVGAIAADRNHPRASWFWIAADNLRLGGENALALARELP
jgi:aspartate-semialdehyde dehydrogenase